MIIFLFSDWLISRNKDPAFEELPDEILAGILRQFFAEVRQKTGKTYSKSAMVNLRSGINRYLQNLPNNRIINLMHNSAFQNANKVFIGVLRTNKKLGLDVRKPKVPISKADLEKLYDQYLVPGLADCNTQILQYKVFVDLVYYMGRRAKEGLKALQKDWFAIKTDDQGTEYVEIIVNETTKKIKAITYPQKPPGFMTKTTLCLHNQTASNSPSNPSSST